MGGVRVRVLGGLEVDGIGPADLGSRKARTLVKLLALARGHPVSVDRLTEILWTDHPPARPGDQLSVLVSRLRRAFGPGTIQRTDAGYSLTVDWIDVDELGGRVDEAAGHLAAGRLAAAATVSRSALALLRGDLLADESDPWWAEAERTAVARLAGRARLIGAEAALRSGDPLAAADLAGAALDHDPYDEAALRLLMLGHAETGRPGSALAAYADTRALLAKELGVSPTPETEALHTALLCGDLSATADPTVRTPSPTRTLPGRQAELAALDEELARAAIGVVLTDRGGGRHREDGARGRVEEAIRAPGSASFWCTAARWSRRSNGCSPH